MTNRIPALIIGGTGYVAGELLRLVGQHPGLALVGVSSESQAGTPVNAAFPHLAPVVRDLPFVSQAELAARVAEGGRRTRTRFVKWSRCFFYCAVLITVQCRSDS